MKLPVDMNLSPRWIDVLNAAGFEAVHWSALGSFDAPDTQIMQYARTNDFIVLTHDLDFGSILAATRGDKPSVVQIRSDDVNPQSIGARVFAALFQLQKELSEGALVTIDHATTSLRILPLRLAD